MTITSRLNIYRPWPSKHTVRVAQTQSKGDCGADFLSVSIIIRSNHLLLCFAFLLHHRLYLAIHPLPHRSRQCWLDVYDTCIAGCMLRHLADGRRCRLASSFHGFLSII
jgi:hypothetical protein